MALVSIDGQWLQANKALCVTFLGYSQTGAAVVAFHLPAANPPEDPHTDLEQLLNNWSTGISTPTLLEKRYYTPAAARWSSGAACGLGCTSCRRSPAYFIAQIEDNDLKQTEWVNKRLMERITPSNEAGGNWHLGVDLEPDIISWDKRMFELYEIHRTSNLHGSSGTIRCCLKILMRKSASESLISRLLCLNSVFA